VPRAGEWPGTPKPPPQSRPKRVSSGPTQSSKASAPQRHQIADWRAFSLPHRGGNVMTPDRVTRQRAGAPTGISGCGIGHKYFSKRSPDISGCDRERISDFDHNQTVIQY
jgi:hypothetical protein